MLLKSYEKVFQFFLKWEKIKKNWKKLEKIKNWKKLEKIKNWKKLEKIGKNWKKYLIKLIHF